MNTLIIINIVIGILFLILLTVTVIMYITRRKAVLRALRRAERRYSTQMKEAESEITRLKYLCDNIVNNTDTNSKQQVNVNQEVSINAETLVIEQKKLEQQKDELSQRNKSLWEMSISIEKEKQYIQQIKNQIEKQHKVVTDSIRYAKLIQNAVLPHAEIIKSSFQDAFLFWRPRDIVSGDFYWMKRSGDIVIFTVADCTGHGVPGAFMSMLGVAFLNEICAEINDTVLPSQILEQMRTKVITTLQQTTMDSGQKDGMDMALCMYNIKNLTLKYSGANNNLYHVRGTELTEYKAVKNPIAVYPIEKPFETIDVPIEKGDYLYIFSDGYADQFSAAQKRKFTSGRFKKALIEINSQTKVAAQQSALLGEKIDDWRGDYHQMDDMMIGGYMI